MELIGDFFQRVSSGHLWLGHEEQFGGLPSVLTAVIQMVVLYVEGGYGR